MKKYLLFCLVCCLSVAFLTSCEKEDQDEMGEYTTDQVSEARVADTTVTEYPAAIDDYVSTNYPDASIEEVSLFTDGNYEVSLSNEEDLLFDSTGQFLEVIMEDDDEDEDYEDDDEDEDYEDDDEDEDYEDDDEDEDEMEVTDYPSAIDDYIAQNYPDAVIDEIELEDDGLYEVELDNDVELLFDAEGNFLEEEVEEEEEEEEDDDDDDGNTGG